MLETMARELFKAGQAKKALMKWREMCILAETFVKHPSRVFIIVRKQIQICLWSLHGSKVANEVESAQKKEERKST